MVIGFTLKWFEVEFSTLNSTMEIVWKKSLAFGSMSTSAFVRLGLQLTH